VDLNGWQRKRVEEVAYGRGLECPGCGAALSSTGRAGVNMACEVFVVLECRNDEAAHPQGIGVMPPVLQPHEARDLGIDPGGGAGSGLRKPPGVNFPQA
jgi:hypothetical protein